MSRLISIRNTNIILFLFFLVINYFQPLNADDLWRSQIEALFNHTIINHLIQDYNTWTGRITAQFLVYTFFNQSYQIYLDIIFNVVNSLLLVFFINVVFKISTKNNKDVQTSKSFLAFLFIFLVIFIASKLFQNAIWKTASLQYFWGICLVLWLYYDQFYKQSSKIKNGVLLFLLGLCIGLYNEIYFAILLIFSATYLFLNMFITNGKFKNKIIWFFYGNLVGGVLLVTAPGNYVRQKIVDAGNQHTSLLEKFYILINSYIHHELFLLMFLLVIMFIMIDKHKSLLIKIMIILSLSAMLFVLLPVANNGVAGRILLFQYSVLLVLLFEYIFSFKVITTFVGVTNIYIFICLNLVILFVMVAAYFSIFKFNQNRYMQIEAYHENGVKRAEFESYQSKIFKNFVYFDDIIMDANNHKNKWFADYYGFDQVLITKE